MNPSLPAPAPASPANPGQDAVQVREMFSAIAPRYDATNDVLSFGMHRIWRRAAVRRSGAKPGDAVLDCATGTGDLAMAFKRVVGPSGRVVGTDFCPDMLHWAPEKARRAGLEVKFQVADAMDLPFPHATFDVASIAFGIRNVADTRRCLAEMARVVKPGGRVVVLEFGQPDGWFGGLFRLYSRRVMPLIGELMTGHRTAYEYLPRTSAQFPAGHRFLDLVRSTGCYESAQDFPLMFGTAHIYVGVVGPRVLSA